MSGILGFTNKIKSGIVDGSAPAFCLVKSGSNQTIAHATWTQLHFQTLLHDTTGGAASTAADAHDNFVVPATGVWHLWMHTRTETEPDNNEDVIIQFRIDGSGFSAPQMHQHSWSSGDNRNIDNEIHLTYNFTTTGSRITCWTAQNSGGNCAYLANYTTFNGMKLI